MRDLAAARHLAEAHLVEDLARLLLRLGVVLLALEGREGAQRLDRELGRQRQRLVRGDERVAPEGSAEPGDAGADDRVVVELDAQRVKVADRLVEDLLEDPVVAREARRARPVHLRLVAERLGAAREGQPRAAALDAGEHRHHAHFERRLAIGRETELEDGPVVGEIPRRRVEGDDGLVVRPAEALVREDDGAPFDARGLLPAALRPVRAADLEDVREVGREVDDDLDVADAPEKVREDDLLGEAAVEDLAAPHVQEVLRVVEQLLAAEVAQHEIDLVVGRVRRLGAQPHGVAGADRELVVGEKARVLVEEPQLARARGGDVALLVGHEERRAACPDEALDLPDHRQDEGRVFAHWPAARIRRPCPESRAAHSRRSRWARAARS